VSSHEDHRDLPEEVFEELARPLGARDQTRRVMRRLARPSARRAWLVLACLTVVLIGGGAIVQWAIAPDRAPTGPTVPSAIRQAIDRHEQNFNSAARTIRQLSPDFAPVPDEPVEEPDPQTEETDPPGPGHA
jgi:hypothetical protein